MAILHQNAADQHMVLDLPAHRPLHDLGPAASVEAEIDAILATLSRMDSTMPDQVIITCMALMARATELAVALSRQEATNRRLKVVRISQLQPTIELIDFTFRGASRLVELRRQEIELSK
jgi:hypothetical protein